MKTSIYIEDGVVQLVITPESKFEKDSIKIFKDKPLEVKLFDGSFYDCRGGWIRQSEHYPNSMYSGTVNEDKSLILKVSNKEQS